MVGRSVVDTRLGCVTLRGMAQDAIDREFVFLDDVARRELVVSKMESFRSIALGTAEAHRRRAKRDPKHADSFLAWAAAYDRQAAHYQQAIALVEAAPMPPKDEPVRCTTDDATDPVAAKIQRATQILVSRGIAATAYSSSIGVGSTLLPNYSVRGVERATWTAEQIADDIEKIENFDRLTRRAR